MNRGSKPPPMRRALWIVPILLSFAMALSRIGDAGVPSPSATPSGPSYFITWRGSAREAGVFFFEHPPGYRVHSTSISVRGSAVVRLNPQAKQFTSEHVLWAADSLQFDLKSHSTWECGDLVGDHSHISLVETNPMPRYPFPIMKPPEKRPDGTWVIKSLYPTWSDTCRYTTHYAGCPWQPFLNRDDITKGLCRSAFTEMIISAPPGTFDVKATTADGSFFSKQVSYEINGRALDVLDAAKYQVTWEITARRIGKCLAAGSIPINDTTEYKLINDEDVEMGVEYGKSTIDPDTGVAPLNIRVTCDQVPIKNAFVDVKVEVQKNTGGHTHDVAGRPRGSLNDIKLTDDKPSQAFMTDDDGRVHLTFKPGKALSCPALLHPGGNCDDIGIAGIYQITATSVEHRDRTATVAVAAEVKGLSRLVNDANNNYINGVNPGSHTFTDFATGASQARLVKFAADFKQKQLDHNQELAACGAHEWLIYPLDIIDISLPFGGLNDLGPPHGPFWSTPHQTHGRGVGVDFSVTRAWPDPGAVIPVCDPYAGSATTTVSPQGWLMGTMMQVGVNYGVWDNWDLCHDFTNPHPKCPNEEAWHLKVKQ